MHFYRLRLADIFNGEIELLEAADLVAHLPADSSSAVYREIVGDDWRWGLTEQLLAGIYDLNNILRWMQTKDATKRQPRHRPEPLDRPGVSKGKSKIQSKFMSESIAVPLDEAKRLLSMPRKPSGEKPIRSGR